METVEETMERKSAIKYWQKRVSTHLGEMRLAKLSGLFPKKEGWRNVVEHELVEAEAGDVLADALGLSNQERQNIYLACLLHDMEKRRETDLIIQIGPSGYEKSQREQADLLRSKGYSEDVIKLTQSVGGGSLLALIEDPKASQLKVKDDIDLLTLIVHYVDDITLNNDIVPLNERIDYLEANPRYKEGNEAGRAIYAGKTSFQVQREVSRQIEEKLAKMLEIDPSEKLPGFIRKEILGRIELERLEQICLEAARQAFNVHEELGSLGKQPKSTNRFGEKTLLGDWECEEAVINVLKNSGLNIKVISEEHGEVVVGSQRPEYLAVLDGIDGTRQYVKEPNPDRRYGTMLTIFDNPNPRYEDSLASFIMDHSSGQLFLALKNKGAFVISDGIRQPVHTSNLDELKPDALMFGDTTYIPHLKGFNVRVTQSSARDCIGLITGEVPVVASYTLKNNLELACVYRLIVEAGGRVIKSEDGQDLGGENYLEYGQGDSHKGIIYAANADIVSEILNKAP